MKKLTRLFFIPLLALAITACKEDPEVTPGPSNYLELESDTVFFAATAAEGRVVQVTAPDNSWTASCDVDWIEATPRREENGIKVLVLDVEANPNEEARTGIVTVKLDEKSAELVVRQLGSNIEHASEIHTDKEQITMGYPATEFPVPIVADGDYTVSTDADWVRYKERQTAEDGKVEEIFTLDRNDQTEDRKAILTFESAKAKLEVKLTQQAYEALHIEKTNLRIGFEATTLNVPVLAAEPYTVTIDVDWISRETEEEGENVTEVFAVAANDDPEARQAEIVFETANTTVTVKVEQLGFRDYSDLGDDEYLPDLAVPVVGATASDEMSTIYSVAKTYDGNEAMDWRTSTTGQSGSVELEYTFDATSGNRIDYMQYVPSTRIDWGRFGAVEVYYTSTGGSEELYGSFDFQQKSSSSKVTFEPAIENVEKIRIVVKSSSPATLTPSGNVTGSAGEIGFYCLNPENFDPLTVFTDLSCSELRPEITADDVDAIADPFYRALAEQMYYGLYDTEFRVCEAKAYPHPDMEAKIYKTNTYTLLDNVTGMYIPEGGQEHYVFVDEDYGQDLSISVIDWVNNEDACQNTTCDYPIVKGRNKILIRTRGLIYVKYRSNDHYAELKPVKVHFPTATVNGYYKAGVQTSDRFYELLNLGDKKVESHFDLLTDHVLLNFSKSTLYSSTLGSNPAAGERVDELLRIYDSVFLIQERMQGHTKYKAQGLHRSHTNRALFSTSYGELYGFSAAYRTGYNAESMAKDVVNPDKLWNKTTTSYNNNIVGGIWGLAHELGHTNQVTGFTWRGLTEVTNNLMCAITQTIFYGIGNTTMRFNDHFNKGMRDIAVRWVTDRDGTERRMTHCESVNTPCVGNVDGGVDPTTQLMPFWQLYLYYHEVMGKNDFYPDFYESLRAMESRPQDDNGMALQMLDFAKLASDAAGEDLSEFCEAWGLPGINNRMKVNHYGQSYITTTQAQWDEVKTYCSKYPKPKLNPFYIFDTNVELYRQEAAVTAGTHSYLGGGVYRMTGWSGVVAWKLVDPETGRTLCVHTPDEQFTYAEVPSVYMSNDAGTDYVYSDSKDYNGTSGTMRALKAMSQVYHPDALVYGVAADGTEVASLSNAQ